MSFKPIPLSEGILPPPAGYVYVGTRPLKDLPEPGQYSYTEPQRQVAYLLGDAWTTGGFACTAYGLHYAVKAGTERARLNGVPDDALDYIHGTPVSHEF
jgi:hypothetical protein